MIDVLYDLNHSIYLLECSNITLHKTDVSFGPNSNSRFFPTSSPIQIWLGPMQPKLIIWFPCVLGDRFIENIYILLFLTNFPSSHFQSLYFVFSTDNLFKKILSLLKFVMPNHLIYISFE